MRARARTHGCRVHARHVDERTGRGQRVGAAAADGDDAVVRLEHVPVAGDLERGVLVGNHQRGLQALEAWEGHMHAV